MMKKFILMLAAASCLWAEEPYIPGNGVSRPIVVERKQPLYTKAATDARLQGTVVVTVVIGTDGNVTSAKVAKSGLFVMGAGTETPVADDHGLQAQAIAAVRDWKFKPGRRDGKAVPVSADIEVEFRLL
jgi:TonB family protein